MKYPSGYGMVFKKVLCDPTISIEAKAIYALLASYTGADEACFPSVPTMAEAMGCSVQSVRNWCKELESKGWVIIVRSDRSSNRYELQIPAPPPPALSPPSTGVEPTSTNDKYQ